MPTAADADAEPRFDDVTGEALNVAALELQRRATQNDYVAAHAPSEDSPLRRVAAVDVAPGRHKYVLAQLAIGDEAALVVRAYAGCAYHANNFEMLTRELARSASTRAAASSAAVDANATTRRRRSKCTGTVKRSGARRGATNARAR